MPDRPAAVPAFPFEFKQQADLLNLSREAVLVLDSRERIIFWNDGAEHVYGWSAAEALGVSPLELLKTEMPRPIEQVRNILRRESRWDYELRQTTREGKKVLVASRWALWKNNDGRVLGRFQVDTDISKAKFAEQELRRLSGRLLTLRDEEQRRFARELHDSVGQLLAGARMNVVSAQKYFEKAEPRGAKFFVDADDLLDQALKEIRTISHLLHPPLLDELGLESALSWYVSGFAERSGIETDCELPEDLGRFPKELELTVFRIVQETLSNVHRHSCSTTAKVVLVKNAHQLRLKVQDYGKGMVLASGAAVSADHVTPGVGISGIRERVRQLGGLIQIRSGPQGTTVEVVFPLGESNGNGGI